MTARKTSRFWLPEVSLEENERQTEWYGNTEHTTATCAWYCVSLTVRLVWVTGRRKWPGKGGIDGGGDSVLFPLLQAEPLLV